MYFNLHTVSYPYPGGHATELVVYTTETGSILVFLEIQSRQVPYLGGEYLLLFPSQTYAVTIIVTFMLYPGNPGGGLTVTSTKKLKHFFRNRLQSRKVSHLTTCTIFCYKAPFYIIIHACAALCRLPVAVVVISDCN